MSKEILHSEIYISVDDINLGGNLIIPEGATSLVIFSHGRGSSRFSPRNNMVANFLNEAGMATLLFDLFTTEEDEIYENRFDISLLTDRLVKVTEWVQEQKETSDLSIGYFGASTGAASALKAAAQLPNSIKTVVSRGGRPDLVLNILDQIKAAVMLIVGGLDEPIIQLNEMAYRSLDCQRELRIIEGASHLFEKSGKLEEVAQLSSDWFKKYL